jgi:hypothetical protein
MNKKIKKDIEYLKTTVNRLTAQADIERHNQDRRFGIRDKRIAELEADSCMDLEVAPLFYPMLFRSPKVNTSDVVLAILNHLKLNITTQRATPEKIVLKKKPPPKKETK